MKLFKKIFFAFVLLIASYCVLLTITFSFRSTLLNRMQKNLYRWLKKKECILLSIKEIC